MPHKVDISHKTIIFITIFILSLWIIYLIRDLLIILFVAVIFVSALSPIVNFFVKLKLPKVLSIALTYIIIISVLTGFLVMIIPPLVEQSNRLIVASPPLITQFFNVINIDKSLLSSELTALSKNLFSITLSVFDNLLAIVFLLVITFYMLLEKNNLESRIASLFRDEQGSSANERSSSANKAERVRRSIIKIEEKLGAWLQGQLILSLLVGIMSYIGLTILNVPYALPLALIAGVMEVVPVIGPIISAIPAIFIALTISPLLSVMVAAMYLIIQQLENSLIVPQVMKRAVGLNPLIVILAIAIGSRLLGISGALLAVPIAVVFQIIAAEIIEGRKS
ncbi:AI-2E family transporter [Candidatus Daviesbacteria bacterium]|nr:AI-2E family transporter [Candidatus Daviesbacteria bacterium]